MPSFNNVQLMGHLVDKPEIKEFKSGVVSNFTLAVNRQYDDDEADFIDVAAWNQGNYELANYTEDYEKGDLVIVHGVLEQQRWEKDGQTRSKVQVKASEIYNFSSLFRQSTGSKPPVDGDHTDEDNPEDIPF